MIGTHHKAGTLWMRTVFRGIARHLSLDFAASAGPAYRQAFEPPAKVPSIVIDQHSRFGTCQWMLHDPECRVFHLIRDPRDVIVSGAHYHCTAPVAAEPWLHEPREKFGGLTYQERLNSLPDDQARYLFEMQNMAKNTLRDMRNWDYANPNAFECRYEDLIRDETAATFGQALSHLGFEEKERDDGCKIFAASSLFGSNAIRKRGHVRSGEPRQWKETFTRELGERFLGLFGDVLVKLGYEQDNSWTATLPSCGRKI